MRHGAASRQEKAHVSDVAAHHDRVGAVEPAAVDVEREPPGRQPAQRRAQAAAELVGRSSHADRFTHGERQELAYAQRRCEREGARAAVGHHVKIERYAHAYHGSLDLPTSEEPPAVKE